MIFKNSDTLAEKEGTMRQPNIMVKLVGSLCLACWGNAAAAQELEIGPFGLKFGQNRNTVELQHLREVSPFGEYDVYTADYRCKSEMSATTLGVFPANFIQHFRLDPDIYTPKSLASDFALARSFRRNVADNRFAIDWSQHGIDFQIYEAVVGGAKFDACLGFIDDELYSVVVALRDIQNFKGPLFASLDQRYGTPEFFDIGRFWASEDRGMIASYDQLGLIYVYAPLRAEVMERQFELVTAEFERAKLKSDF